MPAPPVIVALTRAGSLELAVWTPSNSDGSANSSAAKLSDIRLDLIACSCDCWPESFSSWLPRRVIGCRSASSRALMIAEVSSPDARPVTEIGEVPLPLTEPVDIALRGQGPAFGHVDRLGQGERAQDATGLVAQLDLQRAAVRAEHEGELASAAPQPGVDRVRPGHLVEQLGRGAPVSEVERPRLAAVVGCALSGARICGWCRRRAHHAFSP